MKVLFAASEMTPYAKTGGLGDVVGALPRKLSGLGHEVTCCLPFYRGVREICREQAHGYKPVAPTEMSGLLQIRLGGRVVVGEVLELRQRDAVRVLFVRCDEFFDRVELYGENGRDYEDNAERFLFFSKAVAKLIDDARFRPDVLHCHDWQTALVPAFAKASAGKPVEMRQRESERPQAGTPALRKDRSTPRTVFTIHNMAYQGIFPRAAFSLTNLPGEFFTPAGLEFYGQMNLMKGGIVFADAITTVSRTYAKEIQTAESGFGLEGVLETRADHLHGIMNGVDYGRWNPETDPHLRQHYSVDDLSGKRACRADLLAKLGLDAGETPGTTAGGMRPVAGFVSRLAGQKGVEVLARAIDDLVRSGVVLAILGKGERKHEELLMAAAKRFPRQVAVRIAHNEELAHQIQAGADMLLVPSHFEPCGLTQLYALKYGTIPVVRATGGLDDTVAQYDARTGEGTGFKFALYESAALVDAVQQAILLYKQPKKWQKLMRNAMACDFSWQASAKEYEKLYAAL